MNIDRTYFVYIKEVSRYFLGVMVLLHIFKGALPLRDVSWNFGNKMVYLEFASKTLNY